MDKTQIILIGPSGVGKSTIGSLIGKNLDIKFYDIDEILHIDYNFEKKTNYNVEEFEEKKRLEFEILENILSNKDEFVIASGEGLIINQEHLMLKKIIEKIEGIENLILILILPHENNIEAKKILMKRFNIDKISSELSLKYDRDVVIFKKIAKKIFYTKDMMPEECCKKILDII